MTDQQSKHVAYVTTLCNKTVVLTYTIWHYMTSHIKNTPNIIRQIKITKGEMGGSRGTYEEEKCKQKFGDETRRKETTLNTQAQMGWCRSQQPRSLRRRSTAARLLRSWVRIPPGAWMFVCCECCVLSGRGLCDELITRPEESYRL